MGNGPPPAGVQGGPGLYHPAASRTGRGRSSGGDPGSGRSI